MTRIDHTERAQRSMEVADSLVNGQATDPFEIANHELSKGLISATLALVEQQRIANLIAMCNLDNIDQLTEASKEILYLDSLDQIMETLE